jgi:cytochrome b
MRYVWDPFIRLCHWGLVIAFSIAFYTHDSEWDRLLHVRAGYVAAGIILARIIWGFSNTGYASFQSFPPEPERAVKYVWRTFQGRAKPFVGHNPAGSLIIYLMLITGLITVTSGFFVYNDGWLFNAPALLHDLHFYSAWTWLILIFTHVTGVITESIIHKDNLIIPMITGVKHDVKNAVEPKNLENVSRETYRTFAIFSLPFRWLFRLFYKRK